MSLDISIRIEKDEEWIKFCHGKTSKSKKAWRHAPRRVHGFAWGME